eukprot:UN20498
MCDSQDDCMGFDWDGNECRIYCREVGGLCDNGGQGAYDPGYEATVSQEYVGYSIGEIYNSFGGWSIT